MGLSAPDFLVIPVLFCHLGVPSCLVGVLCAFSLAATRFRKRSAFCILHASSCRSRSAWWCLSSASCFCRSASSWASCSTVSCISCGMASYLRCTITCLCRSTSWLRWLASRSHGSVACLFRLALPLVLDHPPPGVDTMSFSRLMYVASLTAGAPSLSEPSPADPSARYPLSGAPVK